MFQAVLNKESLPAGRLGAALGVAVAIQAACVFAAVTLAADDKVTEEVVTEVKFVTAKPPPPPPPPPPAAARTVQRPQTRPKPKLQAPRPERVQPLKPAAPVPEPDPQDAPEPEPTTPAGIAAEHGVEGGVEGGVPGGVVGGVIGGVLPEASAGEAVPFSEEMGKPELLRGDPPQYTPEAIAQGASGLMLVKCVITRDGLLDRCRIIKPVPGMEESVLSALKTYRYKPITQGGRAINVEYLLKFRFVPPSR